MCTSLEFFISVFSSLLLKISLTAANFKESKNELLERPLLIFFKYVSFISAVIVSILRGILSDPDNCLCCFFLPHFFLLIVVFGRTAKSFLANVSSLVTQEACDQVRTHSININKFEQNLFLIIRDVGGTWHALFTINSIHNIRKSTRNSQELVNKLVRR